MARHRELKRLLAGDDRRSIGKANEVVERVLSEPATIGGLVSLLIDVDPVISMRAADACEKVSVRRPDLIDPFRSFLIKVARSATQSELKWHLAQMAPRLQLDARSRKSLIKVFACWLSDDSRIVRVSALDAIVQISQRSPKLHVWAQDLLDAAVNDPAPSVRARARKLKRSLRG